MEFSDELTKKIYDVLSEVENETSKSLQLRLESPKLAPGIFEDRGTNVIGSLSDRELTVSSLNKDGYLDASELEGSYDSFVDLQKSVQELNESIRPKGKEEFEQEDRFKAKLSGIYADPGNTADGFTYRTRVAKIEYNRISIPENI